MKKIYLTTNKKDSEKIKNLSNRIHGVILYHSKYATLKKL